jgi:hypothetical protein
MELTVHIDASSGTTAALAGILTDMIKERVYEENTWGTVFDNKNTLNDWVTFTNIYLGGAAAIKATPGEQRKGVLKAATLLVAALQSFDRNGGFAPRHYDPENPNPTAPLDLSRAREINDGYIVPVWESL